MKTLIRNTFSLGQLIICLATLSSFLVHLKSTYDLYLTSLNKITIYHLVPKVKLVLTS